ncbi:hypothetical protein KDL44_12830 [bacterium]|nr:hypothetical protein [bacterium]
MNTHSGKTGRLYRLSVLIFPLVLALVLAACGGGGGLTAEPAASLDNTSNTGQPALSSTGELLPLGSPLPALPQDSGTADAAGSRSTSAAKTYNGSDFLIAAGGTVDGTSLLLQSSADDPAWAMYKSGGLQGEKVLSFALETRPGDLETTYYVALGSFSDNRWHWVVETTLPEVNVDFSDSDQQWISQLGNLYWVVLVDGGKQLHVDQATITTGNGNPGGGPGGGPGDPCFALGPIDSIDDLSIIVANHYFIHNADTQWLDMMGNEIDSYEFAVGMFVLVEGYMAEDPVIGGGCIATTVQMTDPNGGGGGGGEFFVIDGPVVEANPEFFTVDGFNDFASQVVIHDEQTLFINADGTPGSWEDLVAGECVHAEGEILENGSWLARLVIIENGNGGGGGGGGGGQSFVLDGIVTAINAQSISVAEGPDGLPTTVGHDDHTLFLLPDGMEGGWQDVAIGDFVHVDGQITPAGAMLADVVMDFGDSGNGGGGGGGGEGFVLDGVITAIDAQSMSISEGPAGMPATVNHDSHTQFMLPDGMVGGWEDVAIGDFVHVDGQILEDGSWLADVVLDFGDGGNGGGGSITIDGEFLSADESTMQVLNFETGNVITILHDELTIWLLPGGPGGWDDMEPGTHVLVEAQTLDDNSLLALVVFATDVPPPGL